MTSPGLQIHLKMFLICGVIHSHLKVSK